MKKLLLIFFLSLSILACDKDDEPTVSQGTPMENLTGSGSKKWKLSVANVGDGSDAISLIQIFPCWGDNELTLRADGTYTLEDTGRACDPKEPTINAAWSLTESPQQIKLGKVTIAGATVDNLILNVTEIKANQFSGVTGRVELGSLTADKVVMTFVEVK